MPATADNSMRTILITALLCTASLLLPAAHAQQGEADRQAIAQLRAEAQGGEAEAQFLLGEAYYVGKFGLATNHVEAVKWFRQAAEQGFAGAQHNLGVCYDKGQGALQNHAEAVKWGSSGIIWQFLGLKGAAGALGSGTAERGDPQSDHHGG